MQPGMRKFYEREENDERKNGCKAYEARIRELEARAQHFEELWLAITATNTEEKTVQTDE